MQRLLATASRLSGKPCAYVPQQCIWNLVEYLSYQRAQVEYSYEHELFCVTFTHTDVASAQRLLDEWASSGLSTPQEQSHRTPAHA